MTRPDLTNLSPDILAYIESMEKEIAERETDGRLAMFLSLNSKMLKMAEMITDATVDLKSDDKTWDRIVKLTIESKDIFENLGYMKDKLGITNIAETAKKNKNPLEERAAQKTK